MHPTPPPTAPQRQGPPSLAALKQQRATQGPKAPAGPAKPKVPAVKLTPEQQAKKNAEDAETKRKEQEKIVAINDEWKAKLTDDEKAEVLRDAAIANKSSVIDGVIQPCKKKKKSIVINCVPGDTKFNTGLSKEAQDAVVKAQEEQRKAQNTKIKIDYGKVADWEGGSFSRGYVPWGPQLSMVDKDIGEKDKPHKVSILVPSTRHNISGVHGQTKPSLAGNSSSGVTVGTGVDFGGKTDKEYRASAKKAAKTSGLLTEAEVDEMVDKLKPYMGLVRLEACKALRKNPLDLTQKEIDLLNYESLMSHTNDTIRQYEQITKKKWTDLSEEEQTAIFGKKYNVGHVDAGLAKAVAKYDRPTVLKDLAGPRGEGPYMKAYYQREDAAGTPRAKAYVAALTPKAAKVTKVVSDSTKLGH